MEYTRRVITEKPGMNEMSLYSSVTVVRTAKKEKKCRQEQKKCQRFFRHGSMHDRDSNENDTANSSV